MTEPANESGLGFFLKSERERKGLTLEHMAKVTRLRMQYVEALENEDWGRLPSLVFVKGFIKSYTKALGLDYREVIGQFQSSIPVHDDLPKPLMPLKKTGVRKSTILIAIAVVVFIVLLSVIFIVANHKPPAEKSGSDSPKITEEKAVQDQGYTERDGQGQALIQDSVGDSLSPETGLDAATEPETRPAGTDIQSPGVGSVPRVTTAIKPVQTPVQNMIAEPAQAPVQKTAAETVATVKGEYALTAYVTERTYIKIYVDNDPPKEYIFSPGSYPQWTGNEGFYLLIGNAAGAEFDFNGKKIKDLGKPGDVVRLRLPENFNLNINE